MPESVLAGEHVPASAAEETPFRPFGSARGRPKASPYASVALFTLIALLMATDVAIEFRQGVSFGLQTFELVIFMLALGGIAFHWRQMNAARRRSAELDVELARAQAEARRWS